MSNSLPTPWIRNTVLSLLDDTKDYVIPRIPRITHISEAFDDIKTIIIDDKENKISVMLTKSCWEAFSKMQPNKPLSSFKNSIVKLDVWHVSSAVVLSTDREKSLLDKHQISFPFAIQAFHISFLCGNNLVTENNSTDVNRDPLIQERLATMGFESMCKRLCKRQFANKEHLPDSKGSFSLDAQFSERNKLTLKKCQISLPQVNYARKGFTLYQPCAHTTRKHKFSGSNFR